MRRRTSTSKHWMLPSCDEASAYCSSTGSSASHVMLPWVPDLKVGSAHSSSDVALQQRRPRSRLKRRQFEHERLLLAHAAHSVGRKQVRGHERCTLTT